MKPAEAPLLWGAVERPCEVEKCTRLGAWRVFLPDVWSVTRASILCCPEHARAAVMEGARCSDVGIHPHYAARGARDLRDVLLLDVADAPDGVALEAWCAAHAVADFFTLPEGLVLDADGVLRYAADVS